MAITPSAKPRRWVIPALLAAVLFLGEIAIEVLGDDFRRLIGPHRKWVWLAIGVAFLVAVGLAIKEGRKEDEPAAPQLPPASTLPTAAAPITHIHNYAAAPPAQQMSLPLLAPPRDFVGRHAELATLREQVKERGVSITGVKGQGGIGKTALALRLAAELKPAYPDGQIYLDLKGVALAERSGLRQEALAPAEVMRQVITAFRPEQKPPDDEAAVQRLYHGVLDGKRALLLFDNAKDAAQVAPLTPPPSCLMLVTSRQAIALPGLSQLNLEVMSEADARALLLGIAPALGPHAARVAELCGRLPLALRAAASALACSPALTPERLVARLEKKRLDFKDETRQMSVAVSLGLSYDLLGEDALPGLPADWRALAVFAGGIDAAAARAVWASSDEDAAAERLERLEQYSLLDWDADEACYRWHDLAREFATLLATTDERAIAQRRHAQHFAAVLNEADELYLAGDVVAGLKLFDRAQPNIEAGLAWAAAHRANDDEAAALCIEYPAAGAYVLDLRLPPRARISWLELQLDAARHLQRREDEGNALGNLGLAYAALGETRKAIEFHQQDLDIRREIGDRRGEGADLGNLGNAYAALGETRKAIEFHQQALVISRKIGDRRGEGADLGNLGLTYAALGETRKAIEFYQQALVIDREIGDRRGEGQALGNLGVAYKDLGETRKAIEFYQQRLDIAREIGDRRGEGNALGNLGVAYDDLGETRKAIEFHQQALDIDREIGDRRGEGTALFNLSLSQDKLGQRAQAVANAEAALRIFEAIEDPNAEKVRRRLAEWRA